MLYYSYEAQPKVTQNKLQLHVPEYSQESQRGEFQLPRHHYQDTPLQPENKITYRHINKKKTKKKNSLTFQFSSGKMSDSHWCWNASTFIFTDFGAAIILRFMGRD